MSANDLKALKTKADAQTKAAAKVNPSRRLFRK
jgi:hypothetical protein